MDFGCVSLCACMRVSTLWLLSIFCSARYVLPTIFPTWLNFLFSRVHIEVRRAYGIRAFLMLKLSIIKCQQQHAND